MNARLVTIVVRSSTDRRLIAEMIPTGMPIASQSIAAPVTSQIVAGRRSKIRFLTGVVRLIAVAEVEMQDDVLHVVASTAT